MISWTQLFTEFESLIPDNDSTCTMVLTLLDEDYKIFRENLILLTEYIDGIANLTREVLDEVIRVLRNIKAKVNNYQEHLTKVQMSLHKSEEFVKKMKNTISKSSVKINLVFANYHTIKKTLLELIDKLYKYTSAIEALDKDFSYVIIYIFI